MANVIKIRRGAVGDLPTLEQAQLGYTTDTDQVFVGDGAANHEFLMHHLFDAGTFLYAADDNTPLVKTAAEVMEIILAVDMPENVSLKLDPALSADTKWSGITEDGTAGTAGLAYGYCYYLASTGKWEKTNATAASTSAGKLGMCVGAAAADATGTLLMYGKIRADDEFPTFTVGGDVFLSAATAGILTSTAPSGTTDFVVRSIGSATTGDSLFFKPDNVYGTLV